MKKVFFVLSLLFLFSCISSEKEKYPDVIQTSSSKAQKNKRTVAYLKEMSEFKESSFQFISKQMKEMIQNYERMKEQLEKIEKKLDRPFSQTFTDQASYQPKLKKEKSNSITLTKKNEEKVIVFLSSPEDYIKLMADLLKGEYKIDEKEKEKLLSNIKNNINQNKLEELEVISKEIIDGEIDKNLKPDEESLELEEDFLEDKEEEVKEPLDKIEDDESTLLSAKKYFKEKSYETAISEFQKYRNQNPQGTYYPEATFYIGKSFKNLKMPIEAEVFFKEIVQSHPKSLWASRAKKFLKE